MATLTFTSHLQRHLDCSRFEVDAPTLAEAFGQVFAQNPQARSYILDDQGGLRTHVAVFIDGERARDRHRLGDVLHRGADVQVLQALTGG